MEFENGSLSTVPFHQSQFDQSGFKRIKIDTLELGGIFCVDSNSLKGIFLLNFIIIVDIRDIRYTCTCSLHK